MGSAAVAAARAVGYRSAGTCEFLLGADGEFYFLEMNTRIQVEHPVTEMVYGVDLVREQLRIARGLPMSVPREPLAPRGWAIECRLTSEDPANGFLPSTGRITYLRPPSGHGVRWDGGVAPGDEIALYYDSLLGKLIVWAPDRELARTKMIRALDELILAGLATNLAFHRRLMADAEFGRGEIDTQFLERRSDLMAGALSEDHAVVAAVAAALAEDADRQRRRPRQAWEDAGASGSAWTRAGRLDGLR
jgi:acetyl-CoA carboxylase biotin carboxylase subunit